MSDSAERASNGPGDAAARNAAAISMSTLEYAVGTGVITPEQLASIIALAPPASFAPAAVPEAPHETGWPSDVEVRRGLNAVSIAYWAGAIAVLFAFGWFLVDRWNVLGAGGVLVIAMVYAAMFLLAARVLALHGFARASALALLLFVGMVPLVTWAVLSLSGYWALLPQPHPGVLTARVTQPWNSVRLLPIDLMTLLAALVAAQRRRDSILGLPMAVALWFATVHIAPAVIDSELLSALASRLMLVDASIFLAVGYALETARAGNLDDEDFAFWFHAVGLLALVFSIGDIWSAAPGIVAHSTLLLGLLLVAAALYLRRRLFVVFAAAGLVAYLAYLAFDVFSKAVGFPVVLATFGIVVILLAVWAQRRYPALLRRTETAYGARRRIPGAWVVLAGGIVIAAALTVAYVPDARAAIAERHQRFQLERWRVRNAKVHARARRTNEPAGSPAADPPLDGRTPRPQDAARR